MSSLSDLIVMTKQNQESLAEIVKREQDAYKGTCNSEQVIHDMGKSLASLAGELQNVNRGFNAASTSQANDINVLKAKVASPAGCGSDSRASPSSPTWPSKYGDLPWRAGWQRQQFMQEGRCLKCERLGHRVPREGLQVDLDKVKAIQDWKEPSTVHEVRSFLGLASYFRKVTKDFASTASPLTDLTKKDAAWNWTGRSQNAFDTIKEALTPAPVLRLPDNTKPFKLVCDASGTGIGAVLMQEENPVAFESRKLTQAEQHYTVTEQELLSVVHALRIFRCYCLGNPTRVVTDHKANTFLQEQKTLSSRQARWSTFLQDYDLAWKYKPGAKNIADPLSRKVMACVVLILTRGRSCQEAAAPQDVLSQETARRQTGAADPFVDTIGTAERDALLSSVQEGYKEDPWFQERRNRKKLKEEEGYWWKAGKDLDALVIPKVFKAGQEDKSLKLRIVSIFHDPSHAGHRGIQGTTQAIQHHYWWPGLIATVEDYISSCDLCQRNKGARSGCTRRESD